MTGGVAGLTCFLFFSADHDENQILNSIKTKVPQAFIENLSNDELAFVVINDY